MGGNCGLEVKVGTSAQLRLVQMQTPAEASSGSKDPTRRVFDHWLFMFGRSPNRCKMGPTRRAAINQALTLYDEDQLMAAIEGMAADPLEDCSSDKMRDAMREIEWLLGREARIERWADRGEALRLRAQRQVDQAGVQPIVEAPEVVDPAAVALYRERIRQIAARSRGVADE